MNDFQRGWWSSFRRLGGQAVRVALGLGIGAGALAGQTKISPQQQEQQAAAFRATLETAATQVRSGNLDGTELAFEAIAKAPADSAARYIETAQHLLHLADKLAYEGSASYVRPLALRALRQLTLAEAKPARPSARAAAKSLTAFIQERYLGDRAAALESYRAAAQALPVNSRATRAKEAVQRLERERGASGINQPDPGR